jgi:transcriptional regulator
LEKTDISSMNVLERINAKRGKMSKSQRVIADYLIENYGKATFMTAAKLGRAVNISEATVVRFAVFLGYEGYPQFHTALEDMVKNLLTTLQRANFTSERYKDVDVIENVMNLDIEKIRSSIATVDRNEFDRAVNLISNARTIYILGSRSAHALSEFMSYYFNLMFKNVQNIGCAYCDIYDHLFKLSKGDVFIAIGFPRYSASTVDALKFALKKGAGTIAITDSKASPLGKIADIKLTSRSELASFADSLVAPLSLINALIVALSIKNKQSLDNTLNELELIWKEHEIYQKDKTESEQ